MAKEVIFITDRFTAESIEHLRQQTDAEIRQTNFRVDKEEIEQATALLVRSRTKINSDLLEKAKKLKAVVTATSGHDHIDLDAARKKNVTVMSVPDANTESAAEHTLLLMLGVLRRLGETACLLRDGRWKDDLSIGRELKGQTVGLIGLGRVGSRVAELTQAFGAEVIAFDPYQEDEKFQKLGIERMGLTEVLAQAEILSLHVPLNSETRHMIRADTLELTQDGLILINTSRGSVIDESALVTALDSKQILGAGLDVFEHEPLARDSRLRKMPNVLLTPHIGAYTHEAFARASYLAVNKLIDFLKTGETSDNLPLQ